MLDYYFDVFLQSIKKIKINEYVKEIERYNDCLKENRELGEKTFFAEVFRKFPEFDAIFKKSLEEKPHRKLDLMQFILENSDFLKKEKNAWIKPVVEVVRKTSCEASLVVSLKFSESVGKGVENVQFRCYMIYGQPLKPLGHKNRHTDSWD